MPVGLFEAAAYESSRVQLAPGETVVLYSDGVTEAHNVAGEEFGEARLADVLKQHHDKPAAETLEYLVAAVKTFAHGVEQYDDVTALVVKFMG
jgi:sigma-B regulation protein RsbU (phosphoserine phosphatase)